ncbi:histone-lysine N-methyltransferase trithorax-like, partial [Homarus americanus]
GGKMEGDELMPAPATSTSPALSASAISRNILRKARLNLNKTTLQKIRNPVSLQRLIPLCDEGSVEGKCTICDIAGGNSRKFGIVFCGVCSDFLGNSSDGPREIFECEGSKGECQIQGLVEEDRCPACWMSRILLSCSMPNLLHDRLRKRLPPMLKEQIPTSLARCMNIGGLPAISEKDAELASHTKRLPLDPGGGGAFGSVMDLPGGWRRKTGPEVIVISPSGEKFKSVQKLEEFLKKQGISTDARVLFGNNSPAVGRSTEVKSRPSGQTNSSGRGKVVMTMLPGGWTRRIKWRSAGDRFDTYVYSPDGRTFRSRRELSAYFHLIGKVDDIHKYFPVVTGNSDASIPSSSDTPGSSSTEPVSSSEPCSEVSSDDKSPDVSESETDIPKPKSKKSDAKNEMPRLTHIKQLKLKNHKDQGPSRSKSMSKLKATDNSEEEPAGQASSTDVTTEGKSVERKHKKTKVIMRSRSLSVGRKTKKGDASFTDTTESESEQRKSASSTMFTKAFSRSRSKSKAKTIDSPSPVTEDKLKAETPVEDFKDFGVAEPDAVVEKAEVTKKPPGRKRKKTTEEEPVLTKPEVEVSDKKTDPKIVLKIPKKAIKPVSKKHRHKHKIVANVSTVVVSDKVAAVQQQTAKDVTATTQDTNPGVLMHVPSTNKPVNEAQGKLFCPGQVEDVDDAESDALVDMSIDSKVSSPNASEGEVVPDAILVPEIKPKSKPKKLSRYQTCRFGSGWSRKIRWNDKGEGKVALLHSPDSQTFRSRIELLAYFKKAGKTKVDLDFYFPPVLKRDQVTTSSETDKVSKFPMTERLTPAVVISTSAQSSEASEYSDSEALVKTSEDSCASGEESKRTRTTKGIKYFLKSGGQPVLKGIPENITEEIITLPNPAFKSSGPVQPLSDDTRKHIPQLGKIGRKIIVVTTQEAKSSVKSETEDGEETTNEAGGPRVKHVCRSQAQVLGIPRAVFPSPRKEDERLVVTASAPVTKGNQKRKIVTVTTTASGKVLRKTQWCNKCPGCTTPNCLKCVNCLDMKKYGGPGTKKKPCVMRKCHNPRLSVKSAISQEGTSSKLPPQVTPTAAPSPTTIKETRKGPIVIVKVQEEKTDIPLVSNDTIAKSLMQEKGDRGDIAAGKQFVPGALVNIDYWQGYDADEMMLTGYPVTTASSLHPQILCFRCGSVGKEQLLYCAWCCEGIHPYCLEDGEGPESEAEEVFWICRRCAVCQVCGAPGADSLLRCSDCRNYYHLECLGPSAHNTCQPTPDRPWEAESWALLGESWPRQSAIYDVSESDVESVTEDVVMHTELDALKDAEEDVNEDDLVPDIFFLPVNEHDDVHNKITELESFGDSLDVDDILDFEGLEDTICLEDSIIEVFRDTDLYKPEPNLTANSRGEEVVSMKDDEYLYLGYKKEYEYPSRKIEISYYRLLQIIHNEVFDCHGYPTWRELMSRGLVKERSQGSGSGSETESASEIESDSESDLDWEDIFETRRHEAAQEMKEREELRREEERKKRELEREKARLERQKELEKEAKVKELTQAQAHSSGFVPKMKVLGSAETVSKDDVALKKNVLFKKKKRRGRPPGSLNKPKFGEEDFVVLDYPKSEAEVQEGDGSPVLKKRCKQPKSWEEFDKLLGLLTSTYSTRVKKEDSNGQIKSKKRKLVFPDNGVVDEKRRNLKLKPKKQRVKNKTDNVLKIKKKAKMVTGIKVKKTKKAVDIKNKVTSLKGKKKLKLSKGETGQSLEASSEKGKKVKKVVNPKKKTVGSDTVNKPKATKKKSSSVNAKVSKKDKISRKKDKPAKKNKSEELPVTKDVDCEESDEGVMRRVKLSSEEDKWLDCILVNHPVIGNSSLWDSQILVDIPHDGTDVVSEQITENMFKVTDAYMDNFMDKTADSTCNSYGHYSGSEGRSIESVCVDEVSVAERVAPLSSGGCVSYTIEVQGDALLVREGEVKGKPEEENSDKENLPNANSLVKVKENGVLGPQRKVTNVSDEADTST